MPKYKKIDFEGIYKRAWNEEDYNREKEKAKKNTKRSLIAIVVFLIAVISFKELGYLIVSWVGLGISVFSFFVWYATARMTKDDVRRLNAINEYRTIVPVLSLVPSDIEFEEVATIDVEGDDKVEAEDELMKKAYLKKADMLVSYNYTVDKTTIVEGNRKKVKSSIEEAHRISAVAVRIIEDSTVDTKDEKVS